MRQYLILLFLGIIVLYTGNQAYSQCPGGSSTGAITPTTSWQAIGCMNPLDYKTFNAVAGNTYVFSMCNGGGSATFNTEITIQDNAGTPVGALGYSSSAAPGCIGSPIRTEVKWVATATATFRVLLTEFWCGNWTTPPCATMAYKMYTPPPAGATCGSSFVIPSVPFTHTGQSTCAAGNEYNSTMGCSSTYMNGADFVYTYVSPGNECLSFSITNTIVNHGLFVLDNCPSAGGVVCLGKIDAPGVTTLNGVSLAAAGTYYIVVSSLNPPSSCLLNYDLEISHCPTGKDCTDPRVIPALPYSASGETTCGYANDYTSADACGSTFMNGQDFVLTYTAAGPECIDIFLTGGLQYTSLFLLDKCPDAVGAVCMASSTPIFGPPSITSASLPAAGTYYIVVDKLGAPNCTPFNILVDTCKPPVPCGVNPPPSDTCLGAIDVTSYPIFCGETLPSYSVSAPGNLNSVFCGVIDNNAWFSFVADSTAKVFYFDVGPCALGQGIQAQVFSTSDCNTFTAVSPCMNPGIMASGYLIAEPLVIGQTYYLMVDGQAKDDCEYTISTDVPLPVEWGTLNLYENEENDVVVQWETVWEKSNYGFMVERGLPNTSQSESKVGWTILGFVDGHGESGAKVQYSFVDEDPANTGYSWYRIRQLDYNGGVSLSNVLEYHPGEILRNVFERIYPNPASSTATVEYILAEPVEASLMLVNIEGRVIREWNFSAGYTGRITEQLNLEGITSGIYFYKMLIGGQRVSGKLIIQ